MNEVDELTARIRSNSARWDRFTMGDGEWELLLGEVERLRMERKKLFDLVSSFKTPLFVLSQATHCELLRIDRQIHDVRKAWFEENGYSFEAQPARWD